MFALTTVGVRGERVLGHCHVREADPLPMFGAFTHISRECLGFIMGKPVTASFLTSLNREFTSSTSLVLWGEDRQFQSRICKIISSHYPKVHTHRVLSLGTSRTRDDRCSRCRMAYLSVSKRVQPQPHLKGKRNKTFLVFVCVGVRCWALDGGLPFRGHNSRPDTHAVWRVTESSNTVRGRGMTSFPQSTPEKERRARRPQLPVFCC